MHTVITDSTGRTWKRAMNPDHRAAGYWYSSAGTMSTLPKIWATRGPLTVKDRQPEDMPLCCYSLQSVGLDCYCENERTTR